MTKKCLVRFDPANPERQSKDFLVPYTDDEGVCQLLGSSSNESSELGLVVLVGRELSENDLFAKLVDTGREVASVDDSLEFCREYLAAVKGLRIGQIVRLVDPPCSGSLEFEVIPKSRFDREGDSGRKKLP